MLSLGPACAKVLTQHAGLDAEDSQELRPMAYNGESQSAPSRAVIRIPAGAFVDAPWNIGLPYFFAKRLLSTCSTVLPVLPSLMSMYPPRAARFHI